MNLSLERLESLGVSVWLDDLGRERIDAGELQQLVDDGIKGVTTNPSIFAAALSKGTAYDARISQLRNEAPDAALDQLMVADVRDACDVLAPVFEATGRVDGRVSLEVDPRLALDTESTIAAAKRLWSEVGKPNLMVKIPATHEGLTAITESLAAGISINITLIFGVGRYREVQDAWLEGLRRAQAAGHDLAGIGSVASFFVSRLDTAVDKRLDALHESGDIDDETHRRLRGRAAVANARRAYRRFVALLNDPRWIGLQAAGAQVQRPLWASTSTKDPTFSPTRYVDELVAAQTVNTMPTATLEAISAAATDWTLAIELDDEAEAADVAYFDELASNGIAYEDVVAQLESDGVASFESSWHSLLEHVKTALG